MGKFNSKRFHFSTGVTFTLTCKFRRDLESSNWHYYEKTDGSLIRFRKEHMVYVDDLCRVGD